MNITRLNGGRYVLAPTEQSWENEGTSNSGAVFLPWSHELMALLSKALETDISRDESLREGVVISLYSACGTYQGDPVRRQRRGLAIFTPELELRYRKGTPVLSPDIGPGSVDSLGIEDARVTYSDGQFFLWYCGYNGVRGMPCCAVSRDLIHWTKQAPLAGELGEHENKDHVIFPEPFGGRWWLMHRPWGREIPDANNYVIRLASAPTPLGPWLDEGELLRGLPATEKKISWVGGGAPPVAIGEGRYFVLYHNGCFFHDDFRRYEACAMIIDLNAYRKGDLSGMVTRRLEPFMSPETQEEHNGALRIDIIFPMSAHVHRGQMYFLYGAGDKATCAARTDFAKALEGLELNGRIPE
jgi:predicted GH43/DUF377 family glycosyl hydrolase